MTPDILNPPSVSALSHLAAVGATPTQSFNPGVIHKLTILGLIEIVHLPSPFKTGKRIPIPHARITAAGLAKTKELKK